MFVVIAAGYLFYYLIVTIIERFKYLKTKLIIMAVNQSKKNDLRFWSAWESSGAVSPASWPVPKAEVIRRELIPTLQQFKLDKKITFTTSALKRMSSFSNGDGRIAREYAGVAILNALQNKKDTIHYDDIKQTDVFEALRLMRGGGDIWDQISYIGLKVPTMLPEGVKLGRLLAEWDADRTSNAIDAKQKGTLPQYLDRQGITFNKCGILRQPEVLLPFKYDPSQEEIGAVARNLANFVETETSKTQDIRDITNGDGRFAHVQFFVQDRSSEGVNPKYMGANYRIAKEFGNKIRLSRETLCDEDHPLNLLEMYAFSL